MSASKTLSLVHKPGGVATDYDATPVLRDAGGAFGVRRVDGGAVIVAAGTPLNRAAAGVYSYPLSGLADGVTYEYAIERTYLGVTRRTQRQFSTPAVGVVSTAPSYLTQADADALAATAFGLAAWASASASDKAAALQQATQDVDRSRHYQGRKYAYDQALEFPRVAWEASNPNQYPNTGPVAWLRGDRIWDWDPVAGVAVVPGNVRLAVLYQADSLLAGKRAKLLDRLHDGLSAQGVGSLSESYGGAGAARVDPLCRRAADLVAYYVIRSGKLL